MRVVNQWPSLPSTRSRISSSYVHEEGQKPANAFSKTICNLLSVLK
jgi:hypothetical protein